MKTNPTALLIAQLAAVIHAGESSDHENFQRDNVDNAVEQAAAIIEVVERRYGPIFEQENANS